jgi:lipid-A-disaccharide synthase
VIPQLVEHWRDHLYWILGILASAIFTLRVLIQWYFTEKKRQSITPPLFWKISLCGNLLMLLHYLVQLQFNFCIVQGVNAVISWRFIQLGKRQPLMKIPAVIFIIIAVLSTITALFYLQSSPGAITWFRSPLQNGDNRQISPIWHLIGTIGIALFASRFWVQWYLSEKKQDSTLGIYFWWMSLLGASFTLLYTLQLQDVVSCWGYIWGIIPYIRNLYFIYFPQVKKR